VSSLDAEGVRTGPGLALLREYHGIKQVEVARQLGIDAARLCRLERGLVPCSPEMAARVRTAIVTVLNARAQRLLLERAVV
jgi:hypothetical protein